MESHGPHVAIFPSPGMGHLIPLVEFAKQLTLFHGFSVTFITTKWMMASHRQSLYMQRVAASAVGMIRFLEFPDVEIEGDDAEMNFLIRRSLLLENTKILVEDALRSSAFPISSFITDLFCTTMFDVTSKLQIPSYVFFTSSASFLCLMLYLPTLVQKIHVSFKDVDFRIEVSGLSPIPVKDLPKPIIDRSNIIEFNWFLQHSSHLHEARGNLINSCKDMEAEQVKALVEGKVLSAAQMPCIYPVGLLISSNLLESDEVVEEKEECLKWLDQQLASSVFFVAFGSRAALSGVQVLELALGLEASGQRFLWVLPRPPPPDQSTATAEADMRHFLPEGFENRTRDRGLVVPSWEPQILVLSHPSTGGFISHCGWNSTIESILHGVSMIAWPLFAEQRMNALFLVKEMKVAIEAKEGPDGLVSKDEVERAARELMEGDDGMKIKRRMRELMEKAKNAMGDGGSSYNAMATMASVWKYMDGTNTPFTT